MRQIGIATKPCAKNQKPHVRKWVGGENYLVCASGKMSDDEREKLTNPSPMVEEVPCLRSV